MHGKRECASNMFLRVYPNITFVLLTELLANNKAEPNALTIQIMDILELPKFFK